LWKVTGIHKSKLSQFCYRCQIHGGFLCKKSENFGPRNGAKFSIKELGLNEKVPGTGKRIEAKLGITQKMDQNRAFFSSCRTTEKNKMNIAA